eukprot:3357584-Lingulodinium_polyedra.AAC.1
MLQVGRRLEAQLEGAQSCAEVQAAFAAVADTLDPWEAVRAGAQTPAGSAREQKLVALENRLAELDPTSDEA